jgi:hypothetical protein
MEMTVSDHNDFGKAIRMLIGIDDHFKPTKGRQKGELFKPPRRAQ